ncbi:hypothetical protein BC829DRAFT_447972 [Chytridium lagenaria]|nr:hypothetical protein BC829DRAFT_447972 [Chytridium lagenaria]
MPRFPQKPLKRPIQETEQEKRYEDHRPHLLRKASVGFRRDGKMTIPPFTVLPSTSRIASSSGSDTASVASTERLPPVPMHLMNRFIPLSASGGEYLFASVEDHVLNVRKGRPFVDVETVLSYPIVFSEAVVLVTLKAKARNRGRGRFMLMFGNMFGAGSANKSRQRRASPSPSRQSNASNASTSPTSPSSTATDFSSSSDTTRSPSPTPTGRRSLALRPRSSPNLAYSASRDSLSSYTPSIPHDASDPILALGEGRVDFKIVSPSQTFAARTETVAAYQMLRTVLERERGKALMGDDGGVEVMDGRSLLRSLRDADDSNTTCASCGAEEPEWVAVEKEKMLALIVCENCSGYYRSKPNFMVRSFLYDVSLFQQTASPYYQAVSTASNVQSCLRLMQAERAAAAAMETSDSDFPPLEPSYSMYATANPSSGPVLKLQRSRTLLSGRRSGPSLQSGFVHGHAKSMSVDVMMDKMTEARKASQHGIKEIVVEAPPEGLPDLRRRRSSVHTSTPAELVGEMEVEPSLQVLEGNQISRRFKSFLGGMKMKPRKKEAATELPTLETVTGEGVDVAGR